MSSAIRTRWTLKSVPARLTFWYVCTLAASLAAFAIFVFLMRAGTLHRELDADLKVRAHQFATELRPALLAIDVEAELADNPRTADVPFIVWERPGRLLFRSASFPRFEWGAERTIADAARAGTPLITARDRSRVAVRVATVVVQRPGADPMVLQVAGSTAPIQQLLGQLAGTMILAILVVLGVASYGSSFTARRALAPVDEIVRRVRHIQTNRLGDRLDVQAGSDELDRLVATLNDMLDRLEESFHAARRFAADASHELQTPLAAIRAAVEMCLRDDRGGGDYRAMAEDVLTEIERLSALVRDLRLLALAEAGHLVARPEPVDVTALVGECCEIARAIAEEKAIRVEARIGGRPFVMGSALHLRRVFLNLLENAVRYSPAGSTVRVAVAPDDGRAVVTVRDEGCGIAPADLPHIFEPFYRSDPARGRETGGTGLGLALADQIVRVHHGRIRVTSTPEAGSVITISVPTVPFPSMPD